MITPYVAFIAIPKVSLVATMSFPFSTIANYSIDGDEVTFVKRLLNELYPNTSFSMVSDTYDYWNMVNTRSSSLHISSPFLPSYTSQHPL